MTRITDTLYLGTYEDALYTPVAEAGIQGTFNLAERSYEAVLPVRHHAIPDEVVLSSQVWQCLIDLLGSFVTTYAPVLVHCRLGVSRSPALVAAYLAATGAYPDPEAALAYVKACRPVVQVHEATWEGICAWWRERQL